MVTRACVRPCDESKPRTNPHHAAACFHDVSELIHLLQSCSTFCTQQAVARIHGSLGTRFSTTHPQSQSWVDMTHQAVARIHGVVSHK